MFVYIRLCFWPKVIVSLSAVAILGPSLPPLSCPGEIKEENLADTVTNLTAILDPTRAEEYINGGLRSALAFVDKHKTQDHFINNIVVVGRTLLMKAISVHEETVTAGRHASSSANVSSLFRSAREQVAGDFEWSSATFAARMQESRSLASQLAAGVQGMATQEVAEQWSSLGSLLATASSGWLQGIVHELCSAVVVEMVVLKADGSVELKQACEDPHGDPLPVITAKTKAVAAEVSLWRDTFQILKRGASEPVALEAAAHCEAVECYHALVTLVGKITDAFEIQTLARAAPAQDGQNGEASISSVEKVDSCSDLSKAVETFSSQAETETAKNVFGEQLSAAMADFAKEARTCAKAWAKSLLSDATEQFKSSLSMKKEEDLPSALHEIVGLGKSLPKVNSAARFVQLESLMGSLAEDGDQNEAENNELRYSGVVQVAREFLEIMSISPYRRIAFRN